MEEEKRRSKDKEINKEGRKLCGWLVEFGWEILNGDIQGEWTYVGGIGRSVIYYVIGNNRTREKLKG